MIKGVRFRLDTRVNPSALLEDPESIQVAIMDITTQLIENSIDWRRASLIIRALQIAVRNARNVHFGRNRKCMVRELPNWDHQWMAEHGELPLPNEELEKTSDQPSAVSSQPSEKSKQESAVLGSQSSVHAPLAANANTSHEAHSGLLPQTCHPQRGQKPLASPHLNSLRNRHPQQSERSATTRPASAASLTAQVRRPPAPNHPDTLSASLSPRQTRQWRELRRAKQSVAGARRGNLSDLKTTFEYAGLDTKPQ
jgi:hypothetical protein